MDMALPPSRQEDPSESPRECSLNASLGLSFYVWKRNKLLTFLPKPSQKRKLEKILAKWKYVSLGGREQRILRCGGVIERVMVYRVII